MHRFGLQSAERVVRTYAVCTDTSMNLFSFSGETKKIGVETSGCPAAEIVDRLKIAEKMTRRHNQMAK